MYFVGRRPFLKLIRLRTAKLLFFIWHIPYKTCGEYFNYFHLLANSRSFVRNPARCAGATFFLFLPEQLANLRWVIIVHYIPQIFVSQLQGLGGEQIVHAFL